MQTSAIGYRVADFLKQYPPFQSMEEADLLTLASRGRVKFHEADEYLCWQGASYTSFVFVIQQGTVSLWEDEGAGERLRDIRGAGDMIGVERYTGAPKSPYSAKASSEVVVYALSADDFTPLLEKYPPAARYVDSYASVHAEFQAPGQKQPPHEMFAADLVRDREPLTCLASDSLQEAALRMQASGAGVIAVIENGRALGVLSAEDIVEWVAAGGGDSSHTSARALTGPCATVGPAASVAACALLLKSCAAAAITSDGSAAAPLQRLITAADLSPAFGDHPVEILRALASATSFNELRSLNQRARALIGEQLTSPAALDWLAEFACAVDAAILRRVLALIGDPSEGCWCFFGTAGRQESLAPVSPEVAFIGSANLALVRDALDECGYAARHDSAFGYQFLHASAAEWRDRFQGWIEQPIMRQMYLARPLFDLRPVAGSAELWNDLESYVAAAVKSDATFLQLLAHDCLGNLPPLTFYHDLVVDESGEQGSVFHLERSAVQPLADVGRVFGIAAGHGLGGSTIERFTAARNALPAYDSVFREAIDTLRVMLSHQARAGIRLRNDGANLPPALLSRQDRQSLKSGFRSILRILEFTADCKWLEAL